MNALFPIDFSFTLLLHEHNLILIFGIVVLFITVLLRAVKTFSIQLVLLLLFFSIEETFSSPLYIVLMILQAAFALWILWKVKEAVDITYYRQSEKTLKRTRDITKSGNAGIHPFLF